MAVRLPLERCGNTPNNGDREPHPGKAYQDVGGYAVRRVTHARE